MKDLIIRNLKSLRKAAGWKTEEVVLIGHSKTFVPYNEKTLEPFLKRVSMCDVEIWSVYDNFRIFENISVI